MKFGLKNRLGKYVFEISVIFLGITLSFLFEEWRTKREKGDITKNHLIEIKEEALSIKHIISIYDSLVKAETAIMDSLLFKKELSNEEAFELLKLSIPNRDFSIVYKITELPTLKATGEIALLDRDIVTYMELIHVAADKIEGSKYNPSIYDRLMNEVVKNTKYVSDRSTNRLSMDYTKFIRSNQEIKELITWRTREKENPLYNLGLLEERCDELIKMVDKELKNS